MRRFGLIGYPIGHSLSPALFGEAYPGGRYDLLEYESFEDAMAVFRREYYAVNVTAPFKEDAFRIADACDGVTARIGAANVLKKTESGTMAFNTDYDAVLAILREIRALCACSEVLVVGCGGAGRAAAVAAADLGFVTFVANRSVFRAEEFCRRCPAATPMGLDSDFSRFGIIVYTLPLKVELRGLRRDAFFVEACYRNPSFDTLFDADHYYSGQRWLREQAAVGFEIMVK